MEEETSATADDNISVKERENDELNDAKFISMVNTKYNGLLRVLTKDNELVVTERPLILAFHNFKKLYAQLEPWCNLMVKIAKKYEKRVDFAIADFSADLSFGCMVNKFNYKLLGPKAGPRVYAFDLHNNQFRMEKFLYGSMLVEFVESLLKGELFISEPIPEADDKKHIKTAVGFNLKNIISSSEKDLLLFFYKRWTYNGKRLVTEMDELARMLQHENILIIRMDVEENHVPPEFNISSYPRCIYIRSGDKNNYIQYEEKTVTIESLFQFIAKNSTNELKCCNRNGMLKEKVGHITELHLESMENIISCIKDNYSCNIRVLKDVKEIEQTEKSLVVAFHNYIKYHMQLEPWYDLIEEVAHTFKGKVDFAIADISLFSIDNQQMEHEDFNARTQPRVYAFNAATDTQCKMVESLSIETLKDFSHKFLHGELLGTKQVTVKNAEPLVKVATTGNFEELVLGSEQNVFIVFYRTEQNRSTEKLLPTMDHLANLLKEDKHQLFVKMNGDVEKPPALYRSVFYPRCFYIRKGENKRRFLYDSYAFNVEKLLHYIIQHSPRELKYYDRDGFLRREYMLPFKEILYVNDTCLSENCRYYYPCYDKIKKPITSKYKLGNIISSCAFEGLLQLRETNENEETAID